jgi:hypothetical protein
VRFWDCRAEKRGIRSVPAAKSDCEKGKPVGDLRISQKTASELSSLIVLAIEVGEVVFTPNL